MIEVSNAPSALGLRFVMLKMRDVVAATGYSSRHIRRLVVAGTFPRPRQLGPDAVAWRSDEVQAWLDNLPEVNIADPARTEIVAAAKQASMRRRAAHRAQRAAEREHGR